MQRKVVSKDASLQYPFSTFFLSLSGLFLLIGLIIPSSLIASDVAEFSFLGILSSPLSFLGITFLQATGISLWLLFIYFLFERKVRSVFTVTLTVAFGLFMLNSFVLVTDYGIMTPDLHFTEFSSVSAGEKAINLIAMMATAIVVLTLLAFKKKKVVSSLQFIIVIAMLFFGIINVIEINDKFINIQAPIKSEDFEKLFKFTTTGKNVLLIVLDNAKSGYLPYIFEEKPELLKSFKGFTYYPNTISFGTNTLQGMPPVFGGYYYAPLEMQKRTDELWEEKANESQLVLPRIMADSGFEVSLYNLPFLDYSLVNMFDNINAEEITGRFNEIFFSNYKDIHGKDYYKILSSNLIKFSFFRASPLILHEMMYDSGNYLSILDPEISSTAYTFRTISNYSSLYYLSDITEITEENSFYSTMFVNELTRHPAFLQKPDYIISRSIENERNGLFADDDLYHVYMASFLLLSRWFDFLKENGVYNNTRIIIVSDHWVSWQTSPFSNNIMLPNRRWLDGYAPLLMVKDFDNDFFLKEDCRFMTNADVPHIAANGFAENLKNPFTGKELFMEKSKGVFPVVITSLQPFRRMISNSGNYKFNEWLHVHTNIFDPANWSLVTIE